MITSPRIAIYSVTGKDYGKKCAELFDPPSLYACTILFGEFAQYLRALDPRDPQADAEMLKLRPFVEIMLNMPDDVTAMVLDTYENFIRVANGVGSLTKEANWCTDISKLPRAGMQIVFSTLLLPENWQRPRGAKACMILLLAFTKYLRREFERDKAIPGVSETERRDRQARIVACNAVFETAVHLGEVAENGGFYVLFPPPPKPGRGATLPLDGDIQAQMGLYGDLLVANNAPGISYKKLYRRAPRGRIGKRRALTIACGIAIIGAGGLLFFLWINDML